MDSVQHNTVTLASFSRHGRRLEWCSQGPTNTMGGSAKLSACMSLCTAPVQPWPAKITASCSDAWTAFRKMSRASCLQQYNIIIICVISYKFLDVSKEHTDSIFRVKRVCQGNTSSQETCSLLGLFLHPLMMNYILWNVGNFYQTTRR
jgi:hypothetical protein